MARRELKDWQTGVIVVETDTFSKQSNNLGPETLYTRNCGAGYLLIWIIMLSNCANRIKAMHISFEYEKKTRNPTISPSPF